MSNEQNSTNRMDYEVAKHLLAIGAIELRPQEPFTWSSGIKSPIYCDNRLTLAYPEVRQTIARGLAQLIKEHYPSTEVVAGTATAGIPHAAWVSDLLDLPMSYVRSSAKGHGRQNQIEGRVQEGDQVVVIEDLISTGKSSLQAVEALRESGLVVLGVVGIFTYGFPVAEQLFQEAELSYRTLTNYQTLIQLAQQESLFSAEHIAELQRWNPFDSE